MEIRPILSALLRNKTGAILIAAQIAVTMTIIINAVFMINERRGEMQRASGVDEANVFVLSYNGFAKEFNEKVQIENDLNFIRSLPGVVDAAQSNSAPLTGGGWSMDLSAEIDNDTPSYTAIYFTDDHGIDAFGLNLVAGRNFRPEDILWRERTDRTWPGLGIITKASAQNMFGDDWIKALDRTVFIADNQPVKVIGIVEKMQAPWNGWQSVERSMLVPQKTLFGGAKIIVRTESGEMDRLMTEVEQGLMANYKGRLVRNVESMAEIRERSYRNHNGVNSILTALIIALTTVTALGIVGLASFSVNRRRKQIGTRRALGATKFHILRYFLIENFLITTVGVTLGAILSVGFNILLVSELDLSPMDWYYIPAGMLLLWCIGIVAVLGPANKACKISPAIATRSV